MASKVFPSVGVWLRLPGILFMEILLTRTFSSDADLAEANPNSTYFEVLMGYNMQIFLYLMALTLILMPVNVLKKIYIHLLWFLCSYGCSQLYNLYKTHENENLNPIEDGVLSEPVDLPQLWVTIFLAQITLCLLGWHALKCNTAFQVLLCFSPLLCWVTEDTAGSLALHYGITVVTFLFFWHEHGVTRAIVEPIMRLQILRQLVGARGVLALALNEYEIRDLTMWTWVVKVLAQFCVNVSATMNTDQSSDSVKVLLMLIFISIVQCTSTLPSLLGLILFMARAIKVQFFLIRSWLNGSFTNHVPDPVDVRVASFVDGLSVMIMCVYVEVADLDFTARATFLIYILLTVLSSQVRTIYTIVDAFLVTMATVRNESIAKHLRTCFLAVFLLAVCSIFTWKVVIYFGAENAFWTVVITHNLIATTGLILSSLAIYLFMLVDNHMVVKFANVDDVVFYMRGFSEVFEFVLTIVVSIFIMSNLYNDIRGIPGAVLLAIYNYYTLMTKGRNGWKAWKMRREAGAKVKSLHKATDAEKEKLEDVCSICYEDLCSGEASIRVTNCNHAFHEHCLKKWFQIQDKCPICHKHYAEKPDEKNAETTEAKPPD